MGFQARARRAPGVRGADLASLPQPSLPPSVPGCVSPMWLPQGLSAGAISGTLSTVSACPTNGMHILFLELLNERQQFPEAKPSPWVPWTSGSGSDALREK